MRGSASGSGSEGSATTHRLAAARRQARSVKVRRLVPGIVVGTTTLAGTGSLVAWVANQPGIKATAVSQTATPPPVAATTSTDPAVLSVQRQLQQEEAALQALQSRMADLAKRAAAERARAASAAGQGSGWSPGSGAQTAASPGTPQVVGAGSLPPLAALPALPPMPALPAPAPAATSSAAPPATATTGASHALP